MESSEPLGPVAGEKYFTLVQAREELSEILADVDEFITMRADLAAAAADGERSVMPLADMKAHEARLSEFLESITNRGVQVKGWAPLLLDFPMRYQGQELLLCWLEGDTGIEWYHDAAHGFAGRRRIDTLDL